MSLGNLKLPPDNPNPFPFKWSSTGFMYLGIYIIPKFDQLFQTNFNPLFDKIKQDLERWNDLPISWLGRILVLKMNVLPRLFYPMQMIPILFNHKTVKKLNGWFSSFIWSKRKPQIRISVLLSSSAGGGLDLPDIKRYQLSAHLRFSWLDPRWHPRCFPGLSLCWSNPHDLQSGYGNWNFKKIFFVIFRSEILL